MQGTIRAGIWFVYDKLYKLRGQGDLCRLARFLDGPVLSTWSADRAYTGTSDGGDGT